MALVNDQKVELDIAPLLFENRTFVPIRFIAETFQAKVTWKEDKSNNGEGIVILSWDQTDSSILQIKMHTQLKLVIIQTIYGKNKDPEVKTTLLDAAPFVKKPENRTMVPLRFISEVLSANVTWIPESKEIIITKTDSTLWIQSIKSTGNHPEIEWEKQYKGENQQFGNFIQQTIDGGFIVTGTVTSETNTDICVLKLNNTGELLWENNYRKEDINYGVAIYQTPDNGYLLFGNTLNSKQDSKSDIYLVKLNMDGVLLWDKKIGEDSDTRVASVKPSKDGGFILCGQIESKINQNEDIFLIKIDVSGNIEWQSIYNKEGIDVSKDVIQLDDLGYAVIGSTLNEKGISQIFVIKTDPIGKQLWQKSIGIKGNFVGNSLVETPDKGFILLAETDSFSTLEGIYLNKIDKYGQTLWEKYYEGSKSTIGYSIEKTNSGYYMIAGATNITIDDLLTYDGPADGYFLFVDAYGNKIWDKIIGGERHDLLVKITRTTDLGFIACGRSSSNDNGLLNVYIVKLTPLEEEKPQLSIFPDIINFGLLEKNSSKITSFITISNNGAQNLTGYLQTDSVWILLSDKSFIIPAFGTLKILVSLNPYDMEEGAYDGKISISSNGGSQRIPILCTIIDNSPKIYFEPVVIDFKTIYDRKPVTLALSIHNKGRKNLYGSIYSESVYLKIDPINFVANEQKVNITLLPAKLKNGNYKSSLKIQSNGGNIDIPVLYNVSFPLIQIILCINSSMAEVNGKMISFDPSNPKIVPFILNGRTMVPVRFISEAFGAEVFWDSFTKQIYLKIPEKEIQMTLKVNSSIAIVNQKQTKLDVPPIIYEKRVYVPIRFIAEAFGATVSLEKNTQNNSCIKIMYEK